MEAPLSKEVGFSWEKFEKLEVKLFRKAWSKTLAMGMYGFCIHGMDMVSTYTWKT